MSRNMLVEWDSGGVEAMAAESGLSCPDGPNCFDAQVQYGYLCSAEQQHFILVCREWWNQLTTVL